MAGRATADGRSAVRRRSVIGGLGGLGAGAIVGGGAGTAAAQTVTQEELRVVHSETFAGLDPVYDRSVGQLRGVGAGEGLLRLTPTGQPEPHLARGYERLDPQTWRIDLRPEARFWSGRPVDARAVVESLERSRQLAPVPAALLTGIRIEALDEWDVFTEGWGTTGDPPAVLGRHVAPNGDPNYMRFRDPQIDDLLAGFADLLDGEERRQQALRLNQRQADLVPFIPLASRDWLIAVDRRVRNFVPHFEWFMHDVHPDLWVGV